MKIAAIYWPTSSVGGINTLFESLRKAAIAQGDEFDVIRCGNLKTIKPEKFAEPKLIRGGDTFITVHGDSSHHPDQIQGTIKWLEENYDAVYFGYLCPHENKAYGSEPVFMPMYTDLKLPKVSCIVDAYWDSYADWAIPCFPHIKRTVVSQIAYAEPLVKMGMPVEAIKAPITPKLNIQSVRSDESLTVWTSQWKTIKGIDKLLPHIPAISEVSKVELYSNGILYYQIREDEEWKAAVGKDHFKEFNGYGKAEFFGYVSTDEIPEILTRSWFMIDLQGIGKPKHEAYRNGAYNYTTIEALLYGSCPILHAQALKSIIPKEFFLTIEHPKEIAELIRTSKDFALDPVRQKNAREWVLDIHSDSATYNVIKESFALPDPVVDISGFLKKDEPADLFSMFG
jgi:hypothetical protein